MSSKSLQDFLTTLQQSVEEAETLPTASATSILPNDEKPKVEKPKTVEPKKVEKPKKAEQPKIKPKIKINLDVGKKPAEKPAVEKPKKVEKQQKQDPNLAERLFEESGTDIEYKQLWLNYYERAQTSKKQNHAVKMMKEGRFTICPDGSAALLPKYRIKSSSSDALRDSWL